MARLLYLNAYIIAYYNIHSNKIQVKNAEIQRFLKKKLPSGSLKQVLNVGYTTFRLKSAEESITRLEQENKDLQAANRRLNKALFSIYQMAGNCIAD